MDSIKIINKEEDKSGDAAAKSFAEREAAAGFSLLGERETAAKFFAEREQEIERQMKYEKDKWEWGRGRVEWDAAGV